MPASRVPFLVEGISSSGPSPGFRYLLSLVGNAWGTCSAPFKWTSCLRIPGV